jgi:hypothetical protein
MNEVQVGTLAYAVFVHQMCCSVRAVDFVALHGFLIAFAAFFKLGATVTIS